LKPVSMNCSLGFFFCTPMAAAAVASLNDI
jgi:hypothetical protein